VVLEACFDWHWAAEALADSAEVHLAHLLGVKGFASRRAKNAGRNAANLADLLRMGRLPETWIAPPEIWELRALIDYSTSRLRPVPAKEASILALSCRGEINHLLPLWSTPSRRKETTLRSRAGGSAP
jgi:hypothetical protein